MISGIKGTYFKLEVFIIDPAKGVALEVRPVNFFFTNNTYNYMHELSR